MENVGSIYYRPQGKVMFSHSSVILFTIGLVDTWSLLILVGVCVCICVLQLNYKYHRHLLADTCLLNMLNINVKYQFK